MQKLKEEWNVVFSTILSRELMNLVTSQWILSPIGVQFSVGSWKRYACKTALLSWRLRWLFSSFTGRASSLLCIYKIHGGHETAIHLNSGNIFIWKRKWQPTPVFLPGESHGQRILAGYRPWDRRVGHNLAQLTHSYLSPILQVKKQV